MKQAPPRIGRTNRQYPNGMYPWRIRPGFHGGGNLRTAYATASVSAASLDDPNNSVTVDGTPVLFTGDVLPDLSVDQGANGLTISVIPQSISALVSHGETSGSVNWSGNTYHYLQFYQAGQKIQPAIPIGSALQSVTGRYGAGNNYEYGQVIVQNYGFYITQLSGQAWVPPYVPDSVALMAVARKASVVMTLKVMILWET